MTSDPKTILLTGGLGYIGSHCAVVLHEAGYRVVLLDNLSNARVEVLDALEQLMGVRPIFVRGDVRDRDLVASILRDHGVDAVMHFAGLKAVGESVEKPLDYFDCNVGGTISLLQAMAETGVRDLVFSSSATVYGEPQYLPMDESHPTGATNPYGRTKLHIEELLRDLAGEGVSAERASVDSSIDSSVVSGDGESVWRVVCLRYFNPVGAHESALIGENPNDRPNNLMPFITQVASGRLDKLSVFGDDYDTPDGTGVRDYIHVMDLAEGHRDALGFLDQHAGWWAINLGTGRGFSVLEMIEAFESSTGVAIDYEIAPRRSGDVASCYAKTDLSKALLGWEAKHGLEAMCASSWAFESGLSSSTDGVEAGSDRVRQTG